QVHDWLETPSGPCLVMQYIPGGSLEARVESTGPLPWTIATRYVADVADGLLLVHQRGLIHRDVKPANILWDPQSDEAVLTDFGIAAGLGDPATAAGTPRFMAAEAFRGVTSASLDVYGLAATLFWLVTRCFPFDGHNADELIEAQERGLPTPDARLACVPAP